LGWLLLASHPHSSNIRAHCNLLGILIRVLALHLCVLDLLNHSELARTYNSLEFHIRTVIFESEAIKILYLQICIWSPSQYDVLRSGADILILIPLFLPVVIFRQSNDI
jgi:hypothetical protein